jgi:hypothetical protein
MEVKELLWQDEPLCRLEHYRAPETSSTILIPGYKLNNFSRNRFSGIGNKMDILYPGISITVEVCNIMLKLSFSPPISRYNVQWREGGGNKMAIIIPVLDVKSRDGGDGI